MTDIAERLRSVVQNLPDEGHDGWCRRAVDVCDEAADEIERLREQVRLLEWCAVRTREIFGNCIVPKEYP